MAKKRHLWNGGRVCQRCKLTRHKRHTMKFSEGRGIIRMYRTTETYWKSTGGNEFTDLPECTGEVNQP